MDDKDTQPSASPDPVPPKILSDNDRKIIQPSAELVEEMKSQRLTNVAPVMPKPQASVNEPASPTAEQVPPNPALITPASPAVPASPAIASAPTQTGSDDTNKPEAKGPSKDRIILMVHVVAGLMVLGSLGELYVWYSGAQSGSRDKGALIELVIVLLVMIGIFLRREIARKIYVVFSTGVVILTALTIQTQLSAASVTGQGMGYFVRFGAFALVAVLPLIFLTRPRVKEVFH